MDLNKFSICSNSATCIEYSPEFYQYLLHIVLNNQNKKICFIFDKKPVNTHLIAILAALALFKENAPSMIENYTKRNFKKGEKVIVQPQGYIYEYDGLFNIPGYDPLLRLKMLNSPNARSFRPEDVLRLQLTTNSRPAGKLDTNLIISDMAFIDSLLNLHTFNNHSYITNQALLYSARNRFDQTLSDVALKNTNTNETLQLKDLKLWGSIDISGELKSYDTRQSGGEPILAVSSEMEDIAMYLESKPAYSKIVFFDNLQKIGNNLHIFDKITEKQHSVVIGSIDELAEINQYLGNTGFTIWQLDSNDFHQFQTANSINIKPFMSSTDIEIRFPIIANDIKNKAQMIFLPVKHLLLEEATNLFNKLAIYSNSNNAEENISELTAKIFYILYDNMAQTFLPVASHLSELDSLRKKLKTLQSWMPTDIYDATMACIDLNIEFQRALEGVTITPKASKIENHMYKNEYSKVLILSKDTEKSERSKIYFKNHNYNIDVDIIKNLHKKPIQIYDAIYLDYWPGKTKFIKLYSTQLFKNMIFAGCNTEGIWYENTLKILNNDLKKYKLDAVSKSQLSSIDESLLNNNHQISRVFPEFTDQTFTKNNKAEEDTEHPIIVFQNQYQEKKRNNIFNAHSTNQDSVDTRLVEYHGGIYSLNQDSYEVLLVQNLSNTSSEKLKIKQIESKNLQIGNIILIRSSGDSSVLADTAKELVGIKVYEDSYQKATYWKKAFESIGYDPNEVQFWLKKYGVNRNLLTIKNWMSLKTIGPQSKDDLEIILKTSHNLKLQNELENIWLAIEEIRALHIKAGNKLTDIIIKELEEGSINLDLIETQEIDLPHGNIKLLEVMHISDDVKKIDRSHANQIHRYDYLTL